MSQPQSPGPWYPPPPPEKKGLSTGAIVGIVLAVVVVVVVVGALAAYAFFSTVQQSANLSQPNIAVTDSHSSYTSDCGVFGTNTSKVYFSATLVNTGGSGFADVGYDINGQQIQYNTYYVGASSQLPVSDSVTVSACYNSSTTYSVVLLSQRPA